MRCDFRSVRIGAAALLAAVATILCQPPAGATGVIIPAPGRVDMAVDPSHHRLYISTAYGDLLCYDLLTNDYLPTLTLGGSLKGMDASPDGKTLAVADDTRNGDEVWVHLVNLDTREAHKAVFPRAFGERGTYSVAYAADGTLLTASDYEGSGSAPLRRYDPAADTVTELRTVNNRTMLSASANRAVIGWAEAGSSGGAFGRYRVSDGDILVSGVGQGTNAYNFEMGTNRDGTQFTIPTFQGAYVYEADFKSRRTVTPPNMQKPIGVAYSPVSDVVYLAWSGLSEIGAYDTKTLNLLRRYDTEYVFANPGNYAYVEGRIKTSPDGAAVFTTVAGGVRYFQTSPYTMADAQGALNCAAGLRTPNADEAIRWNQVIAGASRGRVDMADATLLLRKVAGHAPNP